MSSLEEALKKNGLSMPNPTVSGGVYVPIKEFGGNFCYLSGCTPTFNGELRFTGKLGRELTVEQGQEAAKLCVLNLVANLQSAYGLDRIKRIVKVLVFVAGTETFYEQPKVANGGTQLLVDIFGEERGCGARSAIGVSSLPGNAPVEIELLVELST